MNNLNSSSVDVCARTAITGVEKERKVGIGVSKASRACVGTFVIGIALGLTN